ncbi:hypothetical protein PROFUN_11997 [Planoprotostelium fungivorum]|uniref:Uncharacterized protein n=1 Tax=Planoprotostelium fungivorum TaxID=1890364 RepID=A0A2P6MRC7_9EUKA|nr:hypothetical protein PROFUN_11997 [Planoprotostelium fungivorum]
MILFQIDKRKKIVVCTIPTIELLRDDEELSTWTSLYLGFRENGFARFLKVLPIQNRATLRREERMSTKSSVCQSEPVEKTTALQRSQGTVQFWSPEYLVSVRLLKDNCSCLMHQCLTFDWSFIILLLSRSVAALVISLSVSNEYW